MIVYVLVPTAVYDHGIIGVYETPEDARAAAEEIWPQTDGHHGFVIHEREIGVTHDDVFTKRTWSGAKLATGPAEIQGP